MDDIEAVEAIADPIERAREAGKRLDAIPGWQTRLRVIRQNAVLEMRANHISLAEIGRLLDLHRNRVQQIAEGRSAGGQGGKIKPADE